MGWPQRRLVPLVCCHQYCCPPHPPSCGTMTTHVTSTENQSSTLSRSTSTSAVKHMRGERCAKQSCAHADQLRHQRTRRGEGVARGRAMGCDGHQWASMCGNGSTLIRSKMEQEVAKDKSHKHHKSTESMVSGSEPKRELVLVPPGRRK
jgi:diaminopimelate epimerase